MQEDSKCIGYDPMSCSKCLRVVSKKTSSLKFLTTDQASRPKYTGMMMKVSETTTGTMPSNAASLPNESTAADDRNLPSVMSTEASVAQEYPLNQGPPSNSFSRSGTAPQSNQDSAENPSDAARPASPLDARLTPQNSLQKNPNQNLGSRQGNKNKDSFQSNRDKEGPVAERSPSLPQADQSFIPQNSGQRNPNQNFGPAENNKNKDFSRPSYQKEQKNVQAAKPPSNSNSAFGPVKKPSQDSTSAEKSQPPKPYQKDYSTTSKPLQPLRAPYNGNSQSDAVRLAFNSKPSFGKKKGAAVKAPASTAAPEAPPPENEGLLNNDQNSQADTDQRVQPPDNDQNLHQNSNGQNFPQATDEQSVPTPPGELNFQERPRKTNPVEKNRAPAAKPAMPRAGSKPKPKKSYVENPEDTNVSPENVGDGQLDSDQGLNGRDPSSWLDKRNGWQSPPDNENQLSPAASQIEAQPVNKNSRVTKPIEYRRQPSDVLPKAKVGLAKKQKPLVAAQKPSLPGQCAPNSCRTPDCYCGGTMVPAGMDIADVPQMILLSFDAGKPPSPYLLNPKSNITWLVYAYSVSHPPEKLERKRSLSHRRVSN